MSSWGFAVKNGRFDSDRLKELTGCSLKTTGIFFSEQTAIRLSGSSWLADRNWSSRPWSMRMSSWGPEYAAANMVASYAWKRQRGEFGKVGQKNWNSFASTDLDITLLFILLTYWPVTICSHLRLYIVFTCTRHSLRCTHTRVYFTTHLFNITVYSIYIFISAMPV